MDALSMNDGYPVEFPEPLLEGVLLRRHRRFLADVRLLDGTEVTAHVPNTGSMLGVATPGTRVWLSRARDPRRRTAFTWELACSDDGALVGVNTALTNRLAAEAIEGGLIPPLAGYPRLRREVPFGRERSRIDLLLEGDAGRCWVEVKSVTLAHQGTALFPDAVTRRGQKHLRELMALAAEGEAAALLFVIQRGDARAFAPAAEIDPDYARLLAAADRAGVTLLAWRCEVSTRAIRIAAPVPVRLPQNASRTPASPPSG